MLTMNMKPFHTKPNHRTKHQNRPLRASRSLQNKQIPRHAMED